MNTDNISDKHSFDATSEQPLKSEYKASANDESEQASAPVEVSNVSNKTKTNKSTKQSGKAIDNLFEDPPISGQLWVCISFVSPELVKNCSLRAVKVRGVYASEAEARKRSKYLQQIDPDFHIFVGEVGKWLGWDPDPNTIEDQEYSEKKLQKLVTEYKKNRAKAKIMEEERKREMLEENVRREAEKITGNKQTKSAKRRERMKKQAEENKMEDKMKELTENRFKPQENKEIKEIKENKVKTSILSSLDNKEEEKTLNNERERILKKEADIKKSVENLSSVDEKLNHLQRMYKEMTKTKSASNSN